MVYFLRGLKADTKLPSSETQFNFCWREVNPCFNGKVRF